MFVLERLLKKRGAVGPAAHRGTAVEAGIVHGLMTGADANESAAKASAEFALLTASMTGDKVDKEARAVPEMTRLGYAELIPYGKPTAMQGRVERRVDGLGVPIMGFFDLCWEQHGILLDKTTQDRKSTRLNSSHT